jgi:ribosome assembly protein 3
MPPATSSREAPKKRNRKRKRRQAASSSSSSSSSSEEEGVSSSKPPNTNQPVPPEELIKEDTEDSSSSSSSEDDSTSGDDENAEMKSPKDAKRQLPSRSPSPVDHRLPINIPLEPSNEEEKQRDAELKEKFRKFWMRTTAEGFKDELGQIQKVFDINKPFKGDHIHHRD